MALPDDIWMELAREQLSTADIISLSSVNKQLRAVLQSDTVWGAIFHRQRGATCLKSEYNELVHALSKRPRRDASFADKCRLALSWRNMLFSLQHVTLPKYDFTFRILMVGESGTGKTSLLYRFIDDEFIDLRNTTFGVDFAIKTVSTNPGITHPREGKLQIWDTSGREKFTKIMDAYYANSHAIMITFDVQNRQSFYVAQQRCRAMKKLSSSVKDGPLLVLVGTKIDLEKKRRVSRSQAEYAAEGVGAIYVETSAKTGVGVEKAFCTAGSHALRKLYFEQFGATQVEDDAPEAFQSDDERSYFKRMMFTTFSYVLKRLSGADH